MEREVFKSKPLRGIPTGLIGGFMYCCIALLIGLALGMDEDVFLPLLGAAVVLGGMIGIISGIGKRIEADENGIYLKKKEYLFKENDMYMHVHTQYYSAVPVTDRWIDIVGKDGKHKIKCSFLGRQDAGRLAKIVEDSMRKKNRTIYGSVEPDDAGVRYFPIPAAEMTEKIDKRNRLMTKLTFWILAIPFSWALICMIIDDTLEEYGVWFMLAMIMNVLILGGVNLYLRTKNKKSSKNIPCEVMFSGGTMYIDGKAYGGADITKVLMTPEIGYTKGDMRRLVIYGASGNADEYSFGFRADRNGFPGYARLVEAVKDNFGEIFAYDIS